MGPKVDAVCRFVQATDLPGVITSLDRIVDAVTDVGTTGTVVVPETDRGVDLTGSAACLLDPPPSRSARSRSTPSPTPRELTKLIDDGVIHADRVIAVIGKTEGNGGVNDYTRIIADRAFREALVAKGRRADAVKEIPIVWSGGTDGVISPHATMFATVPDDGRRSRPTSRG